MGYGKKYRSVNEKLDLNNDYEFHNTNIVKPLAGKSLSDELKKHHIYVTASINEPSGNHHIEAAQCGLPVLYFNSGGIPEYCDGYGVKFDNNFEEKLLEIIKDFEIYKDKLKKYPYSAEVMCQEFYETFNNVKKNKIIKEAQVNKLVRDLFLVKNKIQKLLTSINLKHYLKQLLKRI